MRANKMRKFMLARDEIRKILAKYVQITEHNSTPFNQESPGHFLHKERVVVDTKTITSIPVVETVGET